MYLATFELYVLGNFFNYMYLATFKLYVPLPRLHDRLVDVRVDVRDKLTLKNISLNNLAKSVSFTWHSISEAYLSKKNLTKNVTFTWHSASDAYFSKKELDKECFFYLAFCLCCFGLISAHEQFSLEPIENNSPLKQFL